MKGFIISSLFLGLQVHANHYQMTYYTLIMLFIVVVIHYWDFFKKNELRRIYQSLIVFLSVGLISLMMNAPSLLATKEYSEFSTRSKNEISINPDGSLKESMNGLDKDYITEYSYGILESFNLIFPRFMGGGSSETIRESSKLMEFIRSLEPNQAQQVYQFSKMYWGNQPIVAAPAYLGISIFFIFLISLLLVNDLNRKWIVISVIISLILSWGKNFSVLTDFMIDSFPLYDKFRAVSSIQVIIEFCIPFLAVLGLKNFFSNDFDEKKKLNSLKYVSVFLISLILIFYVFGGYILDFKSDFEIFSQYPEILNLIIEERKYLFEYDLIRSLIIVISVAIILFLFLKKLIKANVSLALLTIVLIFDLWDVNKSYVNADQFVNSTNVISPFTKAIYDEAILRDKSDFRVYEPQRGFSNARTSYFHKSIAGYHAAKPKRIQNLYDFYISNNNMKILSMLNVKYLIQISEDNPLGVTRNPNNLGNAWFIEETKIVDSADEELLNLNQVELKSICITQDQSLKGLNYKLDNRNSIELVKRKANELVYKSSTTSTQFAVISEAFYKKGWQAYIDNKPVSHYKVNYLLRGLIIPEGDHEIVFKFYPEIVKSGVYISIVSYLILFMIFIKLILDKKNVQKTTK